MKNTSKFIFLIFSLFIAFILSSCGNDGAIEKPSSSVTLPRVITEAKIADSASIQAYLRVDDGVRQQMTVSGSNASLNIASLSPGLHQFSITLEYNSSPSSGQPIVLAQTSHTANISAGNNTPLEFTDSDFDFQAFDLDGDGISNLDEILTDNARLHSVSLSVSNLNETFDPNVSSYSANVDNDISNIEITVTPQNSAASVSINGNSSGIVSLQEGLNNFNIVVTAEDGVTIQSYFLAISRPYSITATAGINGTISPLNATVHHGDSTSFIVTADNGYHIDTVTGCNGSLNGSVYTTGAVSASCTVSASFIANGYTVSGHVSGLNGAGLVLLNNNGDNLSISANGEFVFATPVADGQAYQVTVGSYPAGPDQFCAVTNGSGTISGAAVSNVAISCVNAYTIGGTVSGLSGSGLILQNNNGDDLSIGGNGDFSFKTPTADGLGYNVTVATQPASLNQTCAVENGAGTLSGSNVISINVVCVTNTYQVGVGVSGLVGSGLVLQNNNGDDLSIDGSGSYTFASPVTDGQGYNVTVATQPASPGQICSVSNGSGTLAGADVTNISVVCVNTYTIGGTVSGLLGSGLVLVNNGLDNLSISSDSSFSFTTAVADGQGFNVTVAAHPSNLDQTCVVSNGNGTVSGANVIDVSVVCTTNSYTIGGNVSGLLGSGMVLQNNAGDDLPVNADGSFSFTTAITDGSSYAVTIASQPAAPTQACMVVNASGTLAGSNASDVSVICPSVLTVSSVSRGAEVSWSDNGASSYDLYRSTDPNCNFDNLNACTGGTATYGATSPVNVSNLVNSTMYYFVVKSYHANGQVIYSELAAARPDDTVLPNDEVRAIALDSDNIAYLGGDFTAMAAYTGSGVPLSTAGNALAGNFPQVDGIVYAVIGDGVGGWYIGGNFDRVGGVARGNLAHILADGSLDSVWAPSASSYVSTLAMSGSTVYAGGYFSYITTVSDGTLPRFRMAAIDTSGQLTDWAPTANGRVNTLATSGNTVYAGGSFTTINGSACNYLAAIDSAGQLTGLAPTVNERVNDLAVSGDTIYAGGYFTTVDGASRNHLAAFGTDASLITDWAPSANNYVSALAISGDTIYVGGHFSTIDGLTRNHLAAIDSAGNLTNWAPSANDYVYSLLASGDTIYAGGDFVTINSTARNHLAAIDSSGNLSNWAPATNGTRVYALAASSSTVYAGGDFNSVNGVTRNHLAAIADTGALTSWAPNADHAVYSLVVSGNTVYTGGTFTTINGEGHRGLVGIGTDGNLSTWVPSVSGSVYTLTVSGSTVYAGGAFGSVTTSNDGTHTRNNLVAIDTAGNLITTWEPAADGVVRTLAISGSTVYAGGYFTSITTPADGVVTRNRLAAIDMNGNLVTSWAPAADNVVLSLAISGDTIYVGGGFTSITTPGDGLATRNSLAAITADGSLMSNWAPAANSSVHTLAVSGDTIFVGGSFTDIDGSARTRLAAIDMTGNLLSNWTPSAGFWPEAILVSGGTVYVGGGFSNIDGDGRKSYYATLPAP